MDDGLTAEQLAWLEKLGDLRSSLAGVVGTGREAALVATKLDEVRLWFVEASRAGE